MALRQSIPLHMHRANRLTTAPASEPVTLAELKTHLRIITTDDDTYLTSLIGEARQYIEDKTGFSFITQTWKMTIDRWPAGNVEHWSGVRQGALADVLNAGHSSLQMPRYPLASIASVTTYSGDSTATSVTVSTTFDVDTQSMPGRVSLQSGATWPSALRHTNAIEIVYVAGYGLASDVPAPMKSAIRNMAAYMYSHRGDGCNAGMAYMESGADGVMQDYRVRSL